MQLHEALKIIANDFGRDIISESRCVNILADYLAFSEYPPCRIILKTIIDEGISAKILCFGTDRVEIVLQLKQYSLNLATKFGFQQPLINYTLKALANATSQNGTIMFNLEKFKYDMTAGAATDSNYQGSATGTSATTSTGSAPAKKTKKPSIPPPVIKTFQRRGEAAIGKECKFVWNVSDATSLHVSGLGDVPLANSGTCKVLINAPYQEIILTATNAGGSVCRTLVVNPGGADAVPLSKINYFRTVQVGKHVGDKTILEWDVDDAKTIYLEGVTTNMVADTGSCEVLIEDKPRSYILKAINAVGKSVTDTIVVQTAPPTILSVVSNSGQNKVKIGTNVEVAWTTDDADSVSISGTGVSFPTTRLKANGSVELTVTEENPCVILTAYNATSSVQDSVKILTEEMENPVIKDFSYKTRKGQSELFVGDSVKCIWDLENATSVEIHEGGNVVFDGKVADSFVYKLSKNDSQLILVAKNSRYEEQQILNIHADSIPVIKLLTTSTKLCKLGDMIDVSWEVEDASQVLLNGNPVASKGTMKIEVKKPKCPITIKAIAGGKTVDKTVDVTAMEHPEPAIRYFRYPEASDRHKGKTINLEWAVDNATEVKLAYNSKKIVTVPNTGQKSFKIMRDKCTLTLIATNESYKTEEQLTVERQKSFWERIF